MYPWVHLAFGYLAYSAYTHGVRWRRPTGREAVAVAFGAVFPDLLDKPLAWPLGVAPSGRAYFHSLLVAAGVVGAAYLVSRARWVAVFGFGYASHIVGDAVRPWLSGDAYGLGFVFWPATSLPTGLTPYTESAAAFFREFEAALSGSPSRFVVLQAAALLVVILVWVVDGAPGVGVVRRGFNSAFSLSRSR